MEIKHPHCWLQKTWCKMCQFW